jgi:hypothetical protein
MCRLGHSAEIGDIGDVEESDLYSRCLKGVRIHIYIPSCLRPCSIVDVARQGTRVRMATYRIGQQIHLCKSSLAMQSPGRVDEEDPSIAANCEMRIAECESRIANCERRKAKGERQMAIGGVEGQATCLRTINLTALTVCGRLSGYCAHTGFNSYVFQARLGL